MNAAHDVMRCRSHFHRLLRDIDIGQLLELVIHARQLALDVIGGVWKFLFDPRNVEVNAAMRTSPALFDFAYDAARDVIPGQ